jgi:predicted O-methyltransferase YrrM
MFRDIPTVVLQRMHELEKMDATDRVDGTEFSRRLRQIPSSTGRLLALTAAGSPPGTWIELGASAGYSALWLSLACRACGRKITTFEPDERKLSLARETVRLAGVEDVVALVDGDARDYLPDIHDVSFCFLDALKEIYLDCYELVVPNLAPGGLLVADNVTSHAQDLAPFIERALTDERVDALVVPVDRGLLLARSVRES